MAHEKNVGYADSVIRILLGIFCIALVAYHFMGSHILPIYTLIPVFILIPFFLKTGLTKVCPIMKAMKMSTNGSGK